MKCDGVLLLGLSELNIQKLKEGQPIMIDDKRISDDKIFITYGKTEERIAADLTEFIGDSTKIFNEMGRK